MKSIICDMHWTLKVNIIKLACGLIFGKLGWKLWFERKGWSGNVELNWIFSCEDNMVNPSMVTLKQNVLVLYIIMFSFLFSYFIFFPQEWSVCDYYVVSYIRRITQVES